METTVDGARVHIAGAPGTEASAPVALLIHGAGQAGVVWSAQAAALAAAGRLALAVDLPGHGCSEGAAPTSVGDAADWTLRLMDALTVETAALAGFT